MTGSAGRAPDPRTDKTRLALIQVGMRLGAQFGFENTSVRKIAEEANVNLAAINYHFGGKEGLREAIIDEIGKHMRERGPGLFLRKLTASQIDLMDVAEIKALIRKIMLVGVKSGGETSHIGDMPQFMHREVFSSGESASHFFDRIFKVEHATMCHLVSRVMGTNPDDDHTKLRALTIIGQSVFMNMSRSLVCATMGWDRIGEDELAQLEQAFWVDV
ncbi:MAG: CerR family C-terminal domain-containing protein [Pseudomonadota bacterium]